MSPPESRVTCLLLEAVKTQSIANAHKYQLAHLLSLYSKHTHGVPPPYTRHLPLT